MLDFGFYNEDCLPRMKEYPDKFFDLAIVDPPYGSGLTEGGGCKGWFTKYHQDSADGSTDTSVFLKSGDSEGRIPRQVPTWEHRVFS